MRLNRLDLTRYGKFTDVSLDFGTPSPGAPDLTVVYGLNEAGKSTAFSGFLDLLFGIPERSDYGFLHSYSALQVGGSLELDGSTHVLTRLKKRSQSLVDAAGNPVNEALLAAALGGIGREAYRTMFSLDDLSLREGGKSILQSEGDLGALLFSASSGLADLGRALTAMQEEADGLHKHRGQKTELARLKRELDGLKEKRAEIDVQALAFSRLTEAARQAEAAFLEAEKELGEARAEESRLARLLAALPLARAYESARGALLPLSGLPRPPRAVTEELPALVRDEARLQTALGTLGERLSALRQEAAEAAPESLIEEFDARMKALDDLRARHRTALSDLPRRRQTLAAEEAALGLLLRTLGQPDHAAPESLVMEAPLAARIRDLIGQKSGLETALSQTGRELERAEQALAALEQEKQAVGKALSPALAARLAAALEALTSRGDLARLETEERQMAKYERQLADLWSPLARLISGPDALPALLLPDRRQMDGWRDTAARLKAEKGRHEAEIRALEGRIATAGRRLSGFSPEEVPDDDAAAALRAERDAAWLLHRKTLSAETATRFETLLARHDALLGRRFARAGDLAEMREIQRAIGEERRALESEARELERLAREEEALAGVIRALLPAGLWREDLPVADALAALATLTERISEARMTRDALEEARERVSLYRQDAEKARLRLCECLAEAGDDASEAPDDAALRQRAEAVLDRHRRDEAETARLARREAELKAEVAERRRDQAAAEAATTRFAADWRAALSRTWFGPETSPAEVRALVDALSDLPSRLQSCAQLRQRIETMEEDQRQFLTELEALVALAGLPATGSPEEREQALLDFHAERRRLSDRATRLNRDIESLSKEEKQRSEEWALHVIARDRLLAAFDVADLDDAIRLTDRLTERDRLEERLAGFARQLTEALQVDSPEAAIALLEGVDAAQTEQAHSREADRISLLGERSRERYGEWTLARDRLDAVGGDGAVAALEASRATLLLTIEDLGYRYLKLKTGVLAAGSALELYREKHRSGMMRRASTAFSQITRGDYTGLTARADKDRETLIGLPREGGSRLTEAMSTGTRYQLYLALRLAGYEEFAAIRPPVPFIADDIMETFDEPRSEEVFRLFGDMARIGQVIYFTHHRHLCDIARTVVPEVRILTLGATHANAA